MFRNLDDRYYNPSTGRFLSEDPIGFAGKDFNLYRYVKNNPLRYTDPSGKDLKDFIEDVKDTVEEVEDLYDNITDFIDEQICKIKDCKGKDPDLDPFDEDDMKDLDDDLKNQCGGGF